MTKFKTGELGEINYNTWRDYLNWKAADGASIPEWSALTDRDRAAWTESARHLAERVVAGEWKGHG